MSLKQRIVEAIKTDQIGYITDFSVTDIEKILKEDHAFAMIDPVYYECVLITSRPCELGKRAFGYSFFDSKNRFPDGTPITIGTVKSITTPIEGFEIVQTARTTYLVI